MLQIALKLDLLRRPSAVWDAMKDEYPDLTSKLRTVGLDGVELSFDMGDDPEQNARIVEQLYTSARQWHNAGFAVHIHPYAKGRANPAAFSGPDQKDCMQRLEQVLDVAIRLAEESGRSMAVVYHAAEVAQKEAGYDPRPTREQLLSASVEFFRAGWEYLAPHGGDVYLVSETQCPTAPTDARVRIADRPDETAAILGERRSGVCLDTGHHLLSVDTLGVEESLPWAAAINHMHLHDVEANRDHRPLEPTSHRVARCVRQAAEGGNLYSATLEYNLAKVLPENGDDLEAIFVHLKEAVSLVRLWAATS